MAGVLGRIKRRNGGEVWKGGRRLACRTILDGDARGGGRDNEADGGGQLRQAESQLGGADWGVEEGMAAGRHRQ